MCRAGRVDVSRSGKSRLAPHSYGSCPRKKKKKKKKKQKTKYLLLQKISVISTCEHSESEFYYPDEFSDNELLEQANTIESKRLSDKSVKKFIVRQKQENIGKKYDMNVLFNFREEIWETREITNIPCVQLDKLLCNFYVSLRKRGKTEYEAETLSYFSRSTQRYLDDSQSKINILKDDEFKPSREDTLHFGHRARHEARQLKFGDI